MLTDVLGRTFRASILMWSVAALSCKSVDSVVDEHRAAAQDKVSALETVAADARERPQVTTATFESKPQGPLEIRNNEGFDTGVVPIYVLDSPCERSYAWKGTGFAATSATVHHRSIPSSPGVWFRDPACLLKKGHPAPDSSSRDKPERVAEQFAFLQRLEHVFVLRYHDYRPPKVLGDAVSGTTFVPGRVVGDLLLYRVSDQSYLGGLPLDVSSSEETSTNPNAAVTSSIDAVLSDFRSNIDSRIRSTLAEHFEVAG